MITRQGSVMVVSIGTLRSHLILTGFHFLLAAWGDGGDLDAGTFKGLGWAASSSTHPCGCVFRVRRLVGGLVGLVDGLQGRRCGNELGCGWPSMALKTV